MTSTPLDFAKELLTQRSASLSCGYLSEEQTLQLYLQLSALERVVRKIPDMNFVEARALIEDMMMDTDTCVKNDLQSILEKFPELAQVAQVDPGVFRHSTNTFDMLNHLLYVLQEADANGIRSLLVLDYDETLISNFNTIRQMFHAMLGYLPQDVTNLLSETIQEQNFGSLQLNDTTYLFPKNIHILNEIVSLPNIETCVITKRNAEGVAEVKHVLNTIGIEGITVIGTIQSDTSTIEKGIVIKNLADKTGVQVIHFAEDSEPHRIAVANEFNENDHEVHIYEVDLKGQVSTPAFNLVMSRFG